MTVLPVPPGAALVLLLVALGLAVWIALQLLRLDATGRLPPGWAEGRAALILLAALVWGGLFLMTLAAAFGGVAASIRDPSAATLGLGGLLVALLGAPFLIWTTVLKTQTVRWQKEGHMTDRISKAVEQLGAERTVKKVVDGKTVETTEPNLEVRIGAILSLERIAQDSTLHDRGRDHVRVMEILCAYIRHNAPASGAKDHDLPDWEPLPDDATPEDRAARVERFGGNVPSHGKLWRWARSLAPPRADIATALKVIARRRPEQLRVEAAWPKLPDDNTVWPIEDTLTRRPEHPGETAIAAADLDAYRLRLKTWLVRDRSYQGYRIDLRNTNLQGADLSQAWLQAARLDRARMEGARLDRARLEGARFDKVRMKVARLVGARMQGASFFKARMDLANFGWAQMDDSTDLTRTSLAEVRVRSVDLSKVRLTPDQIASAFGDASVILPGGVAPGHPDWPAHWPAWALPHQGAHAFRTEWQKWRADPAAYRPPPPPDALPA